MSPDTTRNLDRTQGATKRHYIRHPTALPVSCRQVDGMKSLSACDLRDANLGGVSFFTDCRYGSGDELELSFPSFSGLAER